MQYYILVILSALCYAVQFAFNKLYQTKKGSAIKTSLKFLAVKGTVAAVVFFFVAWVIYGRPLSLHPMSVILALLAAVMGSTCFILGFFIFKYGSVSIFTTFLMIGGMTLPFVYSAIRGEHLGIFKILGIILLISSLCFSLFGKGRGEKKGVKTAVVFVLMCGLVFLCNGGMSVFSSIHSGEDFLWFTQGTVGRIFPTVSLERVQGVEFTVLVNIGYAIICSSALGIICLRDKLKKPVSEGCECEISKKKTSAVYLFFLICACAILDALAFVLMRIVDGSGQIVASKYPVQTAFTVVLTAVAGYIAFKEKPNKWGLVGLVITFLSTFLFII